MREAVVGWLRRLSRDLFQQSCSLSLSHTHTHTHSHSHSLILTLTHTHTPSNAGVVLHRGNCLHLFRRLDRVPGALSTLTDQVKQCYLPKMPTVTYLS